MAISASATRLPRVATMAEAEAEAFRPAKRLKAALAPNIFAQFTALANQHKVWRKMEKAVYSACFVMFMMFDYGCLGLFQSP